MPDIPRRRIVLDSIGRPVEEISDAGLADAVTRHMTEHPPASSSSDAQIAAAVSAYLAANPPQSGSVDPAIVAAAVNAYVAANPPAPGDKGPVGDEGPAGGAGPTGQAGEKGLTGDTGAAGIAGPAGEKGATGDAGAKGHAGDKGVTGDKGPTGDAGPMGTDGWTRLKLAADFTTSSATAVDIPSLAFTPAAGKTYEFEGQLNCRTATATVGPRPGLAWPGGLGDGAASIYMPSSASAEVQAHGNIAAPMLAPAGGLPTTTGSYAAKIAGSVTAGATPSGAVRLQLASETAGTVVTVKAGSFLRYKEVA